MDSGRGRAGGDGPVFGELGRGKTSAVAVARNLFEVNGTPYTEVEDTDELGRERVWFIVGRPDPEATR
ncbi:hypothetical protein QQY66_49145 [Streptomyces sp. DG2A-72]|uniref:hypothetical protein n=1 Tax=Streptomyces sp. DG2A-72 TaxID=3051386 RepID=UPI00265C296A|nr:hypothetical protein [Streptomyces sp. DG2A-72]MDO0939281.1 hypothetical protein [Streptomyces sp. DG2A-72]